MKTLNQIKDEAAIKYGHASFTSFKVKCYKDHAHGLMDMIAFMDEVSTIFAKEVSKEALKNASENATLLSSNGKRREVSDTVNIQSTGWSVFVNKESILNENNIPEL